MVRAALSDRHRAVLRCAGIAVSSLVSVAILLLAPAGARGQERRCRDLGASCYCSEPLDNTDTYSGVHDPSDSTTKQCGVYDAATPGQGTADFPVRLPPGATTRNVLSVARDTGVGKFLVWPPSPSLEMTNKTFCVRSYRNYGQGHALPGNFKIARIGSPPGTVAWQSAWSPNGGALAEPSVSWISALGGGGSVDCHLGTTGTADQQIHFPDCQSHWCRFEICSDHNGATGEFSVRAQWSQVAGPKHMESYLGAPEQYGPDCSPERSTTASITDNLVLAEFASVCCPETAGGSIYLSHIMASHGSYDPNFWIGPAVEVEGGGRAPQVP